jgi:hypothetical protein
VIEDMSALLGVDDLGLRYTAALKEAEPGQAWCQWVKLASTDAYTTSKTGWYAPGRVPVKMSQRREFWVEVLALLTEEGNKQLDGCHCLGGTLSLGGPGFVDAGGFLAFLVEQDPVTALHYLLPAMGRYGVWLDPLSGTWALIQTDNKLDCFRSDMKNKESLRQFLGAVSATLAAAGVQVQANYLDRQVESVLDAASRKIVGWPSAGPEGQWFYTKEKIALWQLVASMLVESPHNFRQIEEGFNLDARQHLEGIKPVSRRCQRIQQKLLESL